MKPITAEVVIVVLEVQNKRESRESMKILNNIKKIGFDKKSCASIHSRDQKTIIIRLPACDGPMIKSLAPKHGPLDA
jgi:hypothetical protein